MKVYISVDDTDNADSPGSGQLSANLAKVLLDEHLVASHSNITRHQLYVHPSIPYTSGNSSMCFHADIVANNLDGLICYSSNYLRHFSAPGSDPGLCVAVEDDTVDRSRLMQFGRDVKREKISKSDAYHLAAQQKIHLSEHGGTGLGVIGALAGFGLRLDGNDGRFRGWLVPGPAQTVLTADALTSHPWVDDVIDDTGYSLAPEEEVILAEDKVKTVLRNHQQVVVVKRIPDGGLPCWRTCSKPEVKTF